MSNDPKAMPSDPTKVWTIIKGIDMCMLITVSDGTSSGRPMSTIPIQAEGMIYLLTESTSSAAKDIAGKSDVLLSYQGGSDHVFISGTATIDADKALIKRLWSTGAQAFWPNGPEASDVVALKVRPAKADYWDGPTPVIGAAKFLFGLLTGKEPALGERGVVQM